MVWIYPCACTTLIISAIQIVSICYNLQWYANLDWENNRVDQVHYFHMAFLPQMTCPFLKLLLWFVLVNLHLFCSKGHEGHCSCCIPIVSFGQSWRPLETVRGRLGPFFYAFDAPLFSDVHYVCICRLHSSKQLFYALSTENRALGPKNTRRKKLLEHGINKIIKASTLHGAQLIFSSFGWER